MMRVSCLHSFNFRFTLSLPVWLMMALKMSSLVEAASVLKQVHVITRHGSRYPLKKSPNLTETSPGDLTPLGERILYDVGLWLRERYDAIGHLQTPRLTQVRLESSSYQRTIVSANSLAAGLFNATFRDPYHQVDFLALPPNLPVYTFEVDSDIIIHGYDKCPTFQQQLDELYVSPPWQSLEQNHSALLQRLATISFFEDYVNASGIIPLKQAYNAYDDIQVAQTECANPNSPTCVGLAVAAVRFLVSDADWAELQALVQQTELLKYWAPSAALRTAGNLYQRVVDRMQKHVAAEADQPSETGEDAFFLYSAHYPVLLGILSALQEKPINSLIPPYGSALVMELYQEDDQPGNWTVQILMRASTPNGTVEVVTLGSACPNNLCPLEKVAQAVDGFSMADWCTDCDNDSADVCLALRQQDSAPSPSTTQKENCTGRLVGTALGSWAAGALMVALAWYGSHRRTRRNTAGPRDHQVDVAFRDAVGS